MEQKRSDSGQAAAKARRTRLPLSNTARRDLQEPKLSVENSAFGRSLGIGIGIASRTPSISQ
jgi:hypothetical protein